MKSLHTIYKELRVKTLEKIDIGDIERGLEVNELETRIALDMAKLAERIFMDADTASFNAFAGTVYSALKDMQTAKIIFSKGRVKKLEVKE